MAQAPNHDALQPLRTVWAARSTRERRLIAAAAAALAALLLWLAVQPAWRTVRQAPAQLDALDLQLQGMQLQAAEARALRALPPLPAVQAGGALQAAVARLGGAARLSLQGERALVTLDGVGAAALQALLAEARTGARARVVEAQLTHGPRAGGAGGAGGAVGSNAGGGTAVGGTALGAPGGQPGAASAGVSGTLVLALPGSGA